MRFLRGYDWATEGDVWVPLNRVVGMTINQVAGSGTPPFAVVAWCEGLTRYLPGTPVTAGYGFDGGGVGPLPVFRGGNIECHDFMREVFDAAAAS